MESRKTSQLAAALVYERRVKCFQEHAATSGCPAHQLGAGTGHRHRPLRRRARPLQFENSNCEAVPARTSTGVTW